MKKYFYYLAVALVSVSLVSCSDDDNGGGEGLEPEKVKLIQKLDSENNVAVFEYNTDNKVTSIKYSLNGALYNTLTFAYDTDGALKQSTSIFVGGNTETTVYTYDGSTINAVTTSTDETEPVKTAILTLNANGQLTSKVETWEGIYWVVDDEETWEGHEEVGTYTVTYTCSYDSKGNYTSIKWERVNPAGEVDTFNSSEIADVKVDSKKSYVSGDILPVWFFVTNSSMNYSFITNYASNVVSYTTSGMWGGTNYYAYTYDEEGYPTEVYLADETGAIITIDGVQVNPTYTFTYVER